MASEVIPIGYGEQAAQPSVETQLFQSLAFPCLCFYVLSQAYMVPVILFGPSWAVWQSLTDISVVMLLGCVALRVAGVAGAGNLAVPIRRMYFASVALAAASYVVLTLDILGLRSFSVANDKGLAVGMFQMYRLCQFAIVLYVASSIQWTRARLVTMRWVVGATLLLSAGSVTLDYLGVFSTTDFAPQIPRSLKVAGPWAFYSRGIVGSAVGTLGFHHVYPPLQILMLSALFLHLYGKRNALIELLVLGLAVSASFIGGSRAGFLVCVVFVVLCFLTRPQRLLVATAIVLLVVSICLASDVNLTVFDPAVQRQTTITASYETDGLSGRLAIWRQRAEFLTRNPGFLILGTGFGTAIETGPNAHLLFLHIVLESGILGLGLFLTMFLRIVIGLWRSESNAKPIFCASVALFVSCFTQETFYPVPALGHFLGLYLLSVAIALRKTRTSVNEVLRSNGF